MVFHLETILPAAESSDFARHLVLVLPHHTFNHVQTSKSRICLQHHYVQIRTFVWRHRGERMLHSCVVHRHTGPLNVAPYIMGLVTTIFQQDNARPHVTRIVQSFFVNQQIELLPFPPRSSDLSPIENMWSIVAQRLTQFIPPAATLDHFWQREEAAWSALPLKNDPWRHEPYAIFSAFRWRYVVGIKTHHPMLLVSSPLHSSLCDLLPKQDVQPDVTIEQ
ncbi:transposable element Tcb1 transposase [Trichonephila clavipes]|nr:transposable element Tcb1 transposase [Trichonephila clavipes]